MYIVLDVSSSAETLGPNFRARKRSRPKAVDNADLSADDADRNEDRSATQSPFHPEEPPEQQRIQFLGLHTSNPVVSYQNRIYSCDWTTTIGTDLLLARPSTRSDSTEHEDLRSHPKYALVATSAVKLLATPSQLVAKQHIRTKQQDIAKEQAVIEVGQGMNESQDRTSGTASIPGDNLASRPRQGQGGFLERLAAAKSAKGEQDEVTLVSKKRFTNTGWRVQKNRQMSETTSGSSISDTDSSRDEEDTVDEEEQEPSRKRRRRSSGSSSTERGWTRGRGGKGRWHRADGGLIRAEQPEHSNDPDTNSTPVFTTTPKTWDELHSAAPDSSGHGAQAKATETPSLESPGENTDPTANTPVTSSGDPSQATPR